MWFEFPKDKSLISLDTQFMFGEHILVCPKLIQPDNEDKLWSVNCTMPTTSNWYYWYNRVSTPGSGFQALQVPDSEQGIFVKGGAIIPILQHTDEMSLLHALGNDITLEIYPDQSGEAQGHLYMDDGATFAYQSSGCEKTYVKFSFTDNVLIHAIDISNKCWYSGAEKTAISVIAIYDVLSEPVDVLLKTTGESLDFKYSQEEKSLTVVDVPLTVYVPGEIRGQKTELVEVVYGEQPKVIGAAENLSFLEA